MDVWAMEKKKKGSIISGTRTLKACTVKNKKTNAICFRKLLFLYSFVNCYTFGGGGDSEAVSP